MLWHYRGYVALPFALFVLALGLLFALLGCDSTDYVKETTLSDGTRCAMVGTHGITCDWLGGRAAKMTSKDLNAARNEAGDLYFVPTPGEEEKTTP